MWYILYYGGVDWVIGVFVWDVDGFFFVYVYVGYIIIKIFDDLFRF